MFQQSPDPCHNRTRPSKTPPCGPRERPGRGPMGARPARLPVGALLRGRRPSLQATLHEARIATRRGIWTRRPLRHPRPQVEPVTGRRRSGRQPSVSGQTAPSVTREAAETAFAGRRLAQVDGRVAVYQRYVRATGHLGHQPSEPDCSAGNSVFFGELHREAPLF